MRNSETFLEAVLHVEHRVYGYKLQMLSLFHLALIEQYCPNVFTPNCSASDLKMAAAICSCKNQREFQRIGKGWRSFLSALYTFETEQKAFAGFLSDFLTVPERKEDSGVIKKIQNTTPFPFALSWAASLVVATGWSWEKAFNETSVNLVFWLVEAMEFRETGKTSIISDMERDVISMMSKR